MVLTMQTGLLLVLGTIAPFIGWMFIYPVDGGADRVVSEHGKQLMADPTLSKERLLSWDSSELWLHLSDF